MKQRTLGPRGPQVSSLGLGCMGFSEFYTTTQTDEAASLAVLHSALELGVTFLDTADMYGPCTNEELIGKAIAGQRERVFLATKFGVVRDADPGKRRISGQPDYVRSACDASLQRLKTDHIDLYYQHRVDASVPIEETVGALSGLVKAGKVRYIALSEPSAETLRRAHKIHPITAVQSEYSLWTRDPEDGVLQACAELGVGFVPYSPLGRGFLTGRFRSIEDFAPDDFRRLSPRFQGENFDRNLALVEEINAIAKQKSATASQLALAWLLAQGPHIVPIPGTTRLDRLKENLGALDVQLDAADLARIDSVAPRGVAAGARYDAGGMRLVNG